MYGRNREALEPEPNFRSKKGKPIGAYDLLIGGRRSVIKPCS
jgi:hypothetical protein